MDEGLKSPEIRGTLSLFSSADYEYVGQHENLTEDEALAMFSEAVKQGTADTASFAVPGEDMWSRFWCREDCIEHERSLHAKIERRHLNPQSKEFNIHPVTIGTAEAKMLRFTARH